MSSRVSSVTYWAGMQNNGRRRWRALYSSWRTGTGSGCEAGGRITSRMNVSVVIPVYKGETLIEPLVAQLSKTLPSLTKRYEIILVNDGSPDNSWSVIQSLACSY